MRYAAMESHTTVDCKCSVYSLCTSLLARPKVARALDPTEHEINQKNEPFTGPSSDYQAHVAIRINRRTTTGRKGTKYKVGAESTRDYVAGLNRTKRVCRPEEERVERNDWFFVMCRSTKERER